MVSSDGLSNDLTDVNDCEFLRDGLTVSAVVLVDGVSHHHPRRSMLINYYHLHHLTPDQFWTAEEVLWHLTHHCVGHEHVDGLGAADPDQLGDGVEEGEAGVGQVVYQDDLQYHYTAPASL